MHDDDESLRADEPIPYELTALAWLHTADDEPIAYRPVVEAP